MVYDDHIDETTPLISAPSPGVSQPDLKHDEITKDFSMSVLGVHYDVRELAGPWYTASVFRSRRTRRVINNISMHMKSGEIVAVLGNSGSGKTSLLDIISCRVPSNGSATGHIYFNHRERTKAMVSRHSSYVMQSDRFLVNLTVKETLTYTAQLKLNSGITKKEIQDRVNMAINEMGLRHVADCRVGGYVERGISGGEKRRVTIAVHLLQNPRILLLDEPTSGLDSFNAHSLITSLANLAHRDKKIILLSIHQPRSDMYRLFDKIGIMSLGEMVYYGPKESLVPYFTSIGYPCPTYANPLDHYVDVASIDRRSTIRQSSSLERLRSISVAYRSSMIFQQNMKDIRGAISTPHELSPDDHGCVSVFGPGLLYSWWTLYRRMNVNLVRDRSGLLMRLFQVMTFSLILLLILGRLKSTEKSIQDRIGVIFETISVTAFAGMLNGISLFPCLRDLYYREARDGLYSTAPFVIAYYVQLIPFIIFTCVSYSAIIYWGVGLNPDVMAFLMFCAVCCLLQFTGEVLAVILLGLIYNPQVASSIGSIILTFSLLVASGLLRNITSMLEIFKSLSWASIHKYSTEVLVANEFKNKTFTCDQNSTGCMDGNTFLAMSFPGAIDNTERNFAVLGGYMAGLMVIGWLSFKLRGLRMLN